MSLTDKQIQAQVSAIRRGVKNGAQHFAIQSSGGRTGPDRLLIDGTDHLILPCVSDLQVREALLQAEQENLPSVLLCSISSDRLGDDVIDRLARRRIFVPQVREMVAELFSVTPAKIDPRVLKTKSLMNALLEFVPKEGYPAVAGGTLDLQTAWLALLSQLLSERIESPSLTHFLEWSTDAGRVQKLNKLDPELKEAFVEWFARSRGESVRFMMAAIDSDNGGSLIPLGCALGLASNPEHYRDAELIAAKGRLEQYFQQLHIDPESARAWSRAADAVLAQMDDERTVVARRALLGRLDEVIKDVGLTEKAWISDHSPIGLEQRYEQLGQALKKALGAKTSSGVENVRAHISQVRKHLLGESDPDRLGRAEMACRLIRWLQTTEMPPSGGNLNSMMAAYHQDGGFIDWARNRLKETDESPVVQAAYDAILKRVDERARHFEKNFALQLQDWTRNGGPSDQFVLIEDVLEKVVTPTAKQKPVLLLVLDGMSVAVFRQLLHDVLRHEWTEIVHEEASLPRPVLATLPSITAISRRALFLGRLDPGTNGTEAGEFKKNDLMFKTSGSQVRPQLFKMGDLSEDSQGGIAPKVTAAIADKKCRVVSVVLNAIDDHLDSGKQVDFTWTRNTIRGLRDLLARSAEAERAVILTSDHGHVLDFGTKSLPSKKSERGDRFRTSTGEVEERELEFDGPRVSAATGTDRITLPWSDTVRYGGAKRGYHGGANPQEMVVPMAIISNVRDAIPEGWREALSYQPAWWQIDASAPLPQPPAKPKPEKAVEGLELFEQANVKVEATDDHWVTALLKSPIYAEQSKLAVRGAPDDKLMTSLLTTLESRGGTAIKQALAQALGMPALRVDGLIQNVSRILNLEGYEVLSIDSSSQTISLDTGLLKTQFDLHEAP